MVGWQTTSVATDRMDPLKGNHPSEHSRMGGYPICNDQFGQSLHVARVVDFPMGDDAGGYRVDRGGVRHERF